MLFQMRRHFVVLVLLAVLAALMLAACAGPLQSTLVEAVDAEASAGSLVIAMPEGEAAQALAAAAAIYSASAGQPVRVAAIPVNQYTRKMQAVLMAGLDDYDLLYLTADALPKWAGYHALRPWSEAAESLPEMWRRPLMQSMLVVEDGGVYGLPAQADPLLLWYRADLLEAGQEGPDQSWKAFRAYAAAVSAGAPGSADRSGFFPAYAERDAALDVAVFLHGFGSQNVLELDAPQAREALEFFSELSRDGLAPEPQAAVSNSLDPARESAGADRASVIEALRAGKAAMGFAPRSAAAILYDCSDAKSPACDDGQPLFKAARPPGDCLLLSELWVWAAPLRSKRFEAAERFASWLMSAEGARAWQAEILRNTALPSGINPEAGSLPAVLETDTCFQSLLPPVRDPQPFWQALADLAGQPTSHQNLGQAVRLMQAELQRQGMSGE